MKRMGLGLVAASLALALGCGRGDEPSPEGADAEIEPPPEYRQLLERGAIPAIDHPRFVGAGEAEIAPDTWVLGVRVGGEPRAYSLNILNRHEVVNDQAGGKEFAAVW